jgi:hypothetical protein
MYVYVLAHKQMYVCVMHEEGNESALGLKADRLKSLR